jgi:acetyl-CoA C-acetyltransferase
MADAYIYDAVRTPRGKGKNTGSLHEITALQLATQALKAIKNRNNLDTSKVDDVILGCVSPVGEQGSDIARIAVLNADYSESTAGVQVDRFWVSRPATSRPRKSFPARPTWRLAAASKR